MEPGESEDDYPDVYEIHTGDGINEGFKPNNSISNENFFKEEERIQGSLLKGIDAKDRTALPQSAHQKIIAKLVKSWLICMKD